MRTMIEILKMIKVFVEILKKNFIGGFRWNFLSCWLIRLIRVIDPENCEFSPDFRLTPVTTVPTGTIEKMQNNAARIVLQESRRSHMPSR